MSFRSAAVFSGGLRNENQDSCYHWCRCHWQLFIAGLTEKLGDDLWIVAEGERKERLEKNGIVINDQKYDLHVKTPEEAKRC